jgi:DNA-binding SARP family transcriptional activator
MHLVERLPSLLDRNPAAKIHPRPRLFGLMICHRELGDHSEALQAYRSCREFLTRLLGVPPNAKAQAVYHSVRATAEAAVC